MFVQLFIFSLNEKISVVNSSGICTVNLLDDICHKLSTHVYDELSFENSTSMLVETLHTIDIESCDFSFHCKFIVGEKTSFLKEYQKLLELYR